MSAVWRKMNLIAAAEPTRDENPFLFYIYLREDRISFAPAEPRREIQFAAHECHYFLSLLSKILFSFVESFYRNYFSRGRVFALR
jgi:hypothetical protein